MIQSCTFHLFYTLIYLVWYLNQKNNAIHDLVLYILYTDLLFTPELLIFVLIYLVQYLTCYFHLQTLEFYDCTKQDFEIVTLKKGVDMNSESFIIGKCYLSSLSTIEKIVAIVTAFLLIICKMRESANLLRADPTTKFLCKFL